MAAVLRCVRAMMRRAGPERCSRAHVRNEGPMLRISSPKDGAMKQQAKTRKPVGLASLPVPVGTAPMEAKLVEDLPGEPGWQFEPKWDGFRCLAFRAGDEVDLRAKSGKPLARYFPEVVAMLRELAPDRFVIDGELALETPAILILFDCLMTPDDEVLLDQPLTARREALEALFQAFDSAQGLR